MNMHQTGNFGDSLAFSQSMPEGVGLHKPPDTNVVDKDEAKADIQYFKDQDQNTKDAMMWEYVIERHGKKEFDAVYQIVKKYDVDRFSDEG